MKNYKTYFLLILIFIAACKKLPKETHKGRNIMACYINGEKWEDQGDFWPGRSNTSIGSYGGTITHNPSVNKRNDFYIYGYGRKKRYESKKKVSGEIYLRIPTFYGVGLYFLNSHSHLSDGAIYSVEIGSDFITDSVHTGEVNIKYYEEGKVCAGTFSFEAINQKGEIVTITDGRFDIGTFDY